MTSNMEADYLATEEWLKKSAAEQAEVHNAEVIYPADNELLLDIDSLDDYDVYEKNLRLLNQFTNLRIASIKMEPSKSGRGHYHIYIRFGNGVKLTSAERILLQAILGSDRRRELLGFIRLLECNHPEDATVFFEPKEEPKKKEDSKLDWNLF